MYKNFTYEDTGKMTPFELNEVYANVVRIVKEDEEAAERERGNR